MSPIYRDFASLPFQTHPASDRLDNSIDIPDSVAGSIPRIFSP